MSCQYLIRLSIGLRRPVICWISILIATIIARALPEQVDHPSSAAKILSSVGKSFEAVTGEFLLALRPGTNGILITRCDAPSLNGGLILIPGGSDPDLAIFAPENLKSVVCRENKEGADVTIKGVLSWCNYKMTLNLPGNTAGLVNSRLEVELTQDVNPDRALFAGRHCELAVVGQVYEFSQFAYRWVYYFNGTPGAETYHTVTLDAGAIPDLNQFIYAGDPDILKATLLYYEDFTSLNPFFTATGTRIRDTVRQPPGSLNSSLILHMGEAADFGYDQPMICKPLKKGSRLLIANSYLQLQPGVPDIHQTTNYCARLINDVAAIYPFLAKPDTKFIDWPRITELGLNDLESCEKELNRPVLIPQAILNSCQRYADCFDSQRARSFTGNANGLWTDMGKQIKLPYGDAWQYLFRIIMAADYALEFNSTPARDVALDTASEVIRAGRAENYVFPLCIDTNLIKPRDVRYEYDCTGAYVYLMMDYHRLKGDPEYIAEARAAADRLLKMGFEYPYEFTTTALGPLGLLRLYKATGDRRYLDGISIPLAAILRHSWLFNPDYQEYHGRTIFRLTEAMPGAYANGWEESALIHFLNVLLLEGGDLLPAADREMTAELLRWKGMSLADSLVPLLPDPSIIFTGIPREWTIPVNRSWYIPLEGFGYLEWDDSGFQDKLGRVSQPPYCFGAISEAAILLFHPLQNNTTLYVETPIALEKRSPHLYSFTILAGRQTFRAALEGEADRLAQVTVGSRQTGENGPSSNVKFTKDASNSRLWFSVVQNKEYTVTFGKP